MAGIDRQAERLHTSIVARRLPYTHFYHGDRDRDQVSRGRSAAAWRAARCGRFSAATRRANSRATCSTTRRIARCARGRRFCAFATTADRCVLTHKRLPDAGPGEDRHKHRIETETVVSDGRCPGRDLSFAGIGRSVSLRKVAFGVERRRRALRGRRDADWQLCGAGRHARSGSIAVAARLGVNPGEYMTLSYGRLFDQWRVEHHSSAEHLTFDGDCSVAGPKIRRFLADIRSLTNVRLHQPDAASSATIKSPTSGR